MAPEALRGEEFDARSDLYSLGATFYQALAGQPPLTGATSAELMTKHIQSGASPLTDVSQGTHPELARVIHRLLEKEPSDRYQSAEDLLDALERVDLSAASRATTSGPIELTVRRKSKTFLLAGLMSLAMIAAIVGFSVWPGAESSPHGPWTELFDGETLAGWRVLEENPCDLHGAVYVRNQEIVLERAVERSTSISWTGPTLPKTNYEIKLEAMRTDGPGCLCHLAFPVGDSHCDLIVGGSGQDGTIVALDRVGESSAIDKDNPTAKPMTFEENRWYCIRVRVTPTRITVLIDDKNITGLSLTEYKVKTPPAWTILQPLGLGNWESASVFRNIAIRRLGSNE